MQDDAAQCARVDSLFRDGVAGARTFHIPAVVLCELVWVLDPGYGDDRSAIVTILRQLLSVTDVRVERSALAWQALGLFEKGKADFSDYVIGLSHRDQGAVTTFTFDRRASGCGLFELVQGSSMNAKTRRL